MAGLDPISLGITGAGLLGQMYGQYQSAQVGQAKRKENERIAKADEAWYKSEYYQDPTKLAQNKAYLERIRKNYQDSVRGATNNAIKAGATPETQVATAGALQGRYAGAVSDLVGQATQYRQNVQRMYDQKKRETDARKFGYWDEEQQSWQNFGNNVAQAGAGLLSAYGQGAFDGTKNQGKDMGNSTKELSDVPQINQ